MLTISPTCKSPINVHSTLLCGSFYLHSTCLVCSSPLTVSSTFSTSEPCALSQHLHLTAYVTVSTAFHLKSWFMSDLVKLAKSGCLWCHLTVLNTTPNLKLGTGLSLMNSTTKHRVRVASVALPLTLNIKLSLHPSVTSGLIWPQTVGNRNVGGWNQTWTWTKRTQSQTATSPLQDIVVHHVNK